MQGTAFGRKAVQNLDEALFFYGPNSQYVKRLGANYFVDENKSFTISCFAWHEDTNTTCLFSNESPGLSVRIESVTKQNFKIVVYFRSADISVFASGESEALIRRKTLAHIAFTYDGAAKTGQIYINGKKSGAAISNPHIISGGSDEFWIGQHFKENIDFYFDGGINHYAVFNKALSEQEIVSISQLGGVLPASTHANCLMHLHKAEGHTWFDCVEQYNYAKPVLGDSWNDNARAVATVPIKDLEYIEYQALTGDSLLRVGLLKKNSISDSGYLFFTANIGYETAVYLDATAIQVGSLAADLDTLRIKRNGSIVEFYHNGVLFTSYDFGQLSDLYAQVQVYSGSGKKTPLVSHNGLSDLRFEKVLNVKDDGTGRLYKDTNLTNTHASLVNFTDAEVGITGLADRTSLVDVYSKEIPDDMMVQFDVGRGGESPASNIGLGTKDFDLEIDLYYSYNNGYPHVFRLGESGDAGRLIIYVHTSNWLSFQLYDGVAGVGGTLDVKNLGNSRLYKGGRYKLLFQKRGFDATQWKITALEAVEPISVDVSMNTLTSNISVNATSKIYVGQEWGGKSPLKCAINYIKMATTDGLFKEEWNFKGSATGIVKATYDAANDIPLYGFAGIDEVREVKTGLPPIQNGLVFDRTSLQKGQVTNFNPTDEKGYTAVFAFAIPNPVDNEYYSIFEKASDLEDGTNSANQALIRALVLPDGRMQFHAQNQNSNGFTIIIPIAAANIDLKKLNVFAIYWNIHESLHIVYCNGHEIYRRKWTTDPNSRGFDTQNIPFTVGGVGRSGSHILRGTMPFLGIWKGQLSRKKLHEISSNGWLSNIGITDDCQLYLPFNEVLSTAYLTDANENFLAGHTWNLHTNGSAVIEGGLFKNLGTSSGTSSSHVPFTGQTVADVQHTIRVKINVLSIGASGFGVYYGSGGWEFTEGYKKITQTGITEFALTYMPGAGANTDLYFAHNSTTDPYEVELVHISKPVVKDLSGKGNDLILQNFTLPADIRPKTNYL